MTSVPASSRPGGAGRPGIRSASTRYLRAHPFSVGITALYLVLALATGPLTGPNRFIQQHFGAGVRSLFSLGYWWSPVTSSFLTGNIAELIVVVVLALVLLGAAERLMGAWRTAFAFAVTAVVAAVVGVGLILLGQRTGEYWATTISHVVTLDPESGIVGAIMTASAFASVLWRRRIRVIVLLLSTVFVLYSGEPSDLYRVIAALAGLALGALLGRRLKPRGWSRSSQHEVRTLLAAATAISALGPFVSLLSRSRVGLLAPLGLLFSSSTGTRGQLYARCEVYHLTSICVRDMSAARINSLGSVAVSVLPLLLLLVAAYGLLRGSRFAAWLAVGVNVLLGLLAAVYYGFLPFANNQNPEPLVRQAVRRTAVPAAVSHPVAQPVLAHGGTIEIALSLTLSFLLPVALAVVIVALRRNFPVRPGPDTVRRYVVVVVLALLALGFVYVVGGLLLRETAFTRPVGLDDLLMDVAQRFIPAGFLNPSNTTFLPTSIAGRLLYHGVGPVFWLVVVIGAVPPILGAGSRQRARDAARARRLLVNGGGDSRSFMVTWIGNDYWFDDATSAAVAYRVVGRVAITVGGPFGTEAPERASLEGFARFCDDNGWTPVFYSVDGALEPVFHGMGWHTMVVAEESVLRPQDWNPVGKKWQDVRSSINRAERAGIRAVWTTYQAQPLSVTAQIASISEEWIAGKELPEMGFTLGGVEELRDPAVRLMLAIDADGRVQGVTSWLPCYRNRTVIGWTLDLMRRREDSINGVMEFLIAQAALRMREDGIEFMSLSAAPLAHTRSGDDPAGGMDTVIDYLSESLEPVYGFRSLLRFKSKFQPELRPLIMAYPDPVALPAVGVALARAYLPELSVGQAASLALSRV